MGVMRRVPSALLLHLQMNMKTLTSPPLMTTSAVKSVDVAAIRTSMIRGSTRDYGTALTVAKRYGLI